MSNSQKLNEILEDMNKEVEQLKDVSGAFQKLSMLLKGLKNIIEKFKKNTEMLDEINKQQKDHQEKVDKSLAKYDKDNKQNNAEFAKLIEEKSDKIRTENKEFYLDLEKTIKLKLEENKTEIKHLIENERNLIRQIFVIELEKNLMDLRQIIENHTVTTKRIIWVFGGLILFLSALTVLKLWL